jgi:hypothetical protein
VPSTVKCSSEVRPFARAWDTTRAKKPFGDIGFQQAIAVLGERGRIPDLVVGVQTYKLTEQQVVIHFFHEQPLAADRIQRLQQLRATASPAESTAGPTLAYMVSNRRDSWVSTSSTTPGWRAADDHSGRASPEKSN